MSEKNISAALEMVREVALLGKSKEADVTLPRKLFSDLLKLALDDLYDEEFYTNRYPDVIDAVEAGLFPSALEHFIRSGIYENRIAGDIPIDENDYLKIHKDVAKAVKSGEYTSAKDHFYAVGLREGRKFVT